MDLYIDSLVFDFCPLLIFILILFVFVFEFNYIFVPRFGFAIFETVECGCGRILEVGARRAPRLLVDLYFDSLVFVFSFIAEVLV